MINIFLLDFNIRKSATYMYDKHIVNQILEVARVFFTVRRLNKFEHKKYYSLYLNNFKKEEENMTDSEIISNVHPVIIWASKSYLNYYFLYYYALCVNDEYLYRYDKNINHKSFQYIHESYNYDIDNNINIASYFNSYEFEMFNFTPEEFHRETVVDSYRLYYFFYKRFNIKYITWTMRNKPFWYSYKYFKDQIDIKTV